MICKQIKLPSLLPILPSLSPIPHSPLLPLTHSHPSSVFLTPLTSLPWPLCFTNSLLISPSGLSYMLNFSCPFILNAKSLSSILHLNIFKTSLVFSVIQARIGSFFIIGIQGFSASLWKLVNNQDHNKKTPSIEIFLISNLCDMPFVVHQWYNKSTCGEIYY